MATFGHFAAGLAAGRIPAHAQRRPRLVQAAFGALALIPDLDDFIPGLRHDGPTGRTHTPAATLGGTAVATAVAWRLGLPPWRSLLAALISLASQPVFDTMTHGKGEATFWPASGKRHLKRLPGLPTWKPEKRTSTAGVRSFLGELAWATPLLVIAALPLPASHEQRSTVSSSIRTRSTGILGLPPPQAVLDR